MRRTNRTQLHLPVEDRLAAGPGRAGRHGHGVGAAPPQESREQLTEPVYRVSKADVDPNADREPPSDGPGPGAGPRRTAQHPRERARLQVRDGQTRADWRHAARLRVHVRQDPQRAGVERPGGRAVFRVPVLPEARGHEGAGSDLRAWAERRQDDCPRASRLVQRQVRLRVAASGRLDGHAGQPLSDHRNRAWRRWWCG